MTNYQYQIFQAAFHVPYTFCNHNFLLLTRIPQEDLEKSDPIIEELMSWHGLATSYQLEEGQWLPKPIPVGKFNEKLCIYHAIKPNSDTQHLESQLSIPQSPYCFQEKWWLPAHDRKELCNGSEEEMLKIWEAPLAIMNAFNERKVPYATYGLGVGFSFFGSRIGELCINSNSIFRLLGDLVMNLAINPFKVGFQPGYENTILTPEEVAILKEAYQSLLKASCNNQIARLI